MKIIFQFNSKSKGKGVADAIKIAKKLKGTLEGDFYKVEFYSFEDDDLSRLKNLVGNLKQTKITAEGAGSAPEQKSKTVAKKAPKKGARPKYTIKWLQEEEIFKTGKHHALQDKIREKFDEAISSQKVMDFEKAIKQYIKVLRLDHNEGYYFCEALSKIGRLYYLQNKFQETFEVYDKFFDLYPDWDKDDGSEELYLEACKKFGNTQKYKEIQKSIKEKIEARKASKKATQTDIVDISSYNLENAEEAIKCFKQAIDSNITNLDFWINLGQAMKSLGQELDDNQYYEKSIESYKKSVEIEPNNYDALLNIGSLYEIMGKMNEAMDYFKLIMDIGDIEQIDNHSKILKSDPKAIKSWVKLGDIYNVYEIYSMAIECYEKALELKSNSLYLWVALGKVHLESEDIQKSLECFRSASKISPERKDLKTLITKLRSNQIGDAYEILESL